MTDKVGFWVAGRESRWILCHTTQSEVYLLALEVNNCILIISYANDSFLRVGSVGLADLPLGPHNCPIAQVATPMSVRSYISASAAVNYSCFVQVPEQPYKSVVI